MQIKIGQIYKIKPEFEDVCEVFLHSPNAKYIKAISCKDFNILNEKKQMIGFIHHPNLEHLEPLEKTLYNLEIGDEVEKDSIKTKILGLIESDPENQVYVISNSKNNKSVWGIFTARELEEKNIKVVQPKPTEEIKEMTVEEVSKLVGKKVKIVEDIKISKEELEKATYKVRVKIEDTNCVDEKIINLKKSKNLCVSINKYGGCNGECGCNVFTYNQAIDDVLNLLKNN